MAEPEATIINVDHSVEGYVLIEAKHWQVILDALAESGAEVIHLYDDDLYDGEQSGNKL